MNQVSPPPTGHRWTDAEWALRLQLADCYHALDYLGWSEMMIFNHISARVSGEQTHYLVNPFGLTYAEVTAKNLLKVDLSGNLAEPSDFPANPAGFALHSAIHAARPDAHCIIHSHTTAISAIALKQAGLEHDDFYGAQVYGQVAYHAFEGITIFSEEKDRMLASLGDKNILILRNHGIAVCGDDIPRAFMRLWTVQRAAEIQCQAGMLPGPNITLDNAVREHHAAASNRLIQTDGFASKVFDATVRRMQAARH